MGGLDKIFAWSYTQIYRDEPITSAPHGLSSTAFEALCKSRPLLDDVATNAHDNGFRFSYVDNDFGCDDLYNDCDCVYDYDFVS